MMFPFIASNILSSYTLITVSVAFILQNQFAGSEILDSQCISLSIFKMLLCSLPV